jgi:NAD(P)-dependent dehydrogenase (short-subunit alcohol dehydrogenase family)
VSGQAASLALVTGGAGDIGSEIARALAAQGARVVLADRRDPQAVAQRLCADGHDAEAHQLDVTSADGWDALAGRVQRRGFPLAVLVNAAGIEGDAGRLWEQSPAGFETVMRVNCTGTFLGMRAILPLMRRAGSGAIVNVSSTAGMLGLPGMAPYVASKHAVIGLTRAAAAEVAKDGIRVNAVCPGPTAGRMIAAIEEGARPGAAERAREIYEAAIPLRRYAEPTEVAATVAYLASPAASYITGAVLPIDGGMSAV